MQTLKNEKKVTKKMASLSVITQNELPRAAKY